jgi:hypothetical protein
MKQLVSGWVQRIAASPKGYRLLSVVFRTLLSPHYWWKNRQAVSLYQKTISNATKSGHRVVIIGLAKPANFNFVRGLTEGLKKHPKIHLLFANLSPDVLATEIARVTAAESVIPFGILPLLTCDAFITPKSTLFWNRPRRGLRIHAFHSPVSLHQVYSEGSFQGFDVFFANGSHQVRELQGVMKARKQKTYRIFEIGSEIIDVYFADRQPFSALNTLVYGPSWGPTSSVRLFGKAIVAAVLDTGVKLIFRPHPVSYLHDKTALSEIEETFANHPNFSVFDIQKGGRIAPDADGLISDFSGVALEFALGYEKPVFFIDVPQKIMNPNWSAYWHEPGVEKTYRDKIGKLAFSPEMLGQQIMALKKAPETFKPMASQYYDELVFNRGQAADMAIRAVCELLQLPNLPSTKDL